MVVAKQLRKSPSAVAQQLCDALDKSIPSVTRIEIAGPGFLNFYLERSFYTEQIERIQTLGSEWGKNNTWQGKKVLVEYTDPNPFKEFHIGHLFTNAVGESIARLF